MIHGKVLLVAIDHGRALPWIIHSEGTLMLWSVEVRCDAEDLVPVMERMREWLDARRIEPDVFRHTAEAASVTIDIQFKVEGEAFAFAEAFSGQLML